MPGHRAASCPTGRPPRLHFDGATKPVSGNAAMSYSTDHDSSSHTGQTYLQCGGVLPIIGSVCCHQLDRLPFMKGRIEETNVQVLRDTGCNGVIVKCDLVPHRCFTMSRQRIILMDRSVIEVPVAKARVDTPVFCGEVYALCIQNPVCEVIIGNIPGVHPNILGTTTNEEMLCTASNDKARLLMDKRTACAVQIKGQCERADRPMKPIMTSDRCRALQMVIQAKHAECCHLRECIDVLKSQAGADIRQIRQQIASTEERYKSEVAHVGAFLAQEDQLAIDLKVTLKQLTEENEATKCRLEDLKSNAKETDQLTVLLDNRQTELQQRAAQVMQLDVDGVVYKTDTERRITEMESTICKGRCENEWKAIQITELEACRHTPDVDLEKCRAMEVLKASGSCDAELNYSLDTCFNESKSLKCCAPVFKLPDFQKASILRTDASDTGLGTLLLQTHDDQLFPVAFASKKLSGPTKVLATVKRECLAILWGIEKFVSYLYGHAFGL